MKNYNLAYNTIGSDDYKVMERFLKNRKYLNQSVYTKNFENKFSKLLGTKKLSFCKFWIFCKYVNGTSFVRRKLFKK